MYYNPTSQINSDNPNPTLESTEYGQNDLPLRIHSTPLPRVHIHLHILATSMDTRGRTTVGCGSFALHLPCVNNYL
jgi:hypothetical protein